MYKSILRPILFELDPEKAHHLTFFLLKNFGFFGKLFLPKPIEDKRLEREVFGIKFKNPVGLALANGNNLPAADPQNHLRKALKDNDLRGYVPTMPTFICGGNQDPTVYFDTNTGAVVKLLQAEVAKNPAKKINITVLDVDADNKVDRPDKETFTLIGQASMNKWDAVAVKDSVQTNFSNSVKKIKDDAAPQGGVASLLAFYTNYHGGLVIPACTEATREFFNQEFKAV